MLAGADDHLLGRGDVDQGSRSGVRVRHPDGDGEAVGCAPECDGQCAGQVDQEGRRSVDEGWRRRHEVKRAALGVRESGRSTHYGRRSEATAQDA